MATESAETVDDVIECIRDLCCHDTDDDFDTIADKLEDRLDAALKREMLSSKK